MRQAVVYVRVSSKEQEKEGFSIPAQLKLLRDYALAEGIRVIEEYVDVETAKQAGRSSFGEMVDYLRQHPEGRVILVEKTDRLYRNLKDWVTLDELDLEIHFVKENVVLSGDSRSSEKFMHGIKVLMAKNYIDNLSEETRKGMTEKAEQGIWPSFAPLGYLNVEGPHGKRIIEPDPDSAPIIARMFEGYASGNVSIKEVAQAAREEGLAYRKSGTSSPEVDDPQSATESNLHRGLRLGWEDLPRRAYSAGYQGSVGKGPGTDGSTARQAKTSGAARVRVRRARHMRTLRVCDGGRVEEGTVHLLPLQRCTREVPGAVHERGTARGAVRGCAPRVVIRR